MTGYLVFNAISEISVNFYDHKTSSRKEENCYTVDIFYFQKINTPLKKKNLQTLNGKGAKLEIKNSCPSQGFFYPIDKK